MRMNKHEQAVEYFKRAALAQSDMAGEATIHLGIAYAQLKKYKEAKNALNEALNLKLPPERTAEVKEIIDATEKAIYAAKPWQVSASTGFQYNTNVFSSSLAAINIGDLRQTTGESDVINFTSFGGRYNFFQEDPWKAGVTYTQVFATYVEHSELNLIGMRPSLFVQWDQSPYSASLEYAYNNFLVEGQQDVQVHSLVPRFVMFHGSRFRSEAATGVEWRISKPGLLDSNRYFLSLMEAYLMLEGKAHIRAGYILSHDDFISSQPDAWIHDALVGTQWPIWKDKWFLDVAGLFTWRNYDFDPVFRKDRRDDEQNLMVQVLGQLNPYTQLALGFNHTWNHSNITSQNVDLFSYTRAVYSCVITFSY
jgi:tetratricopeptide (TPR) repeat protein